MKKLILTVAILVMSSSYAYACRGTTEFPLALKTLQGNTKLSAEKKADLMETLADGNAIHKAAHNASDSSQMRASLKILDALKPKIAH